MSRLLTTSFDDNTPFAPAREFVGWCTGAYPAMTDHDHVGCIFVGGGGAQGMPPRYVRYQCTMGKPSQSYNQLHNQVHDLDIDSPRACVGGLHGNFNLVPGPYTVRMVFANVTVGGHAIDGIYVGTFFPGGRRIIYTNSTPALLPSPEPFPFQPNYPGSSFIFEELIFTPYINALVDPSSLVANTHYERLRYVMALRSTCKRFWESVKLKNAVAWLWPRTHPPGRLQTTQTYHTLLKRYQLLPLQHAKLEIMHRVVGGPMGGTWGQYTTPTFHNFGNFVWHFLDTLKHNIEEKNEQTIAFSFLVPVRSHASNHPSKLLAFAYAVGGKGSFKARGWFQQKLFKLLEDIARTFEDAGWGFWNGEYHFVSAVQAAFKLTSAQQKEYKGMARVLFRLNELLTILSRRAIPKIQFTNRRRGGLLKKRKKT